MSRADVLLVEMGLAPSRAKAQELIEEGRVALLVDGRRQLIKKASQKINPADMNLLQIENGLGGDFVSRGGVKLRGALDRLKLNVSGFGVLDVGISTGGFTDCLLQSGAQRSVGVDVGHGQLAPRLASDPRVRLFEGVNARVLSAPEMATKLLDANQRKKFDLVVIDVSFISLTLVLPEVIPFLKDTAHILALVKPQFEVGREGLGKNGVVKDLARHREVEAKIRRICQTLGLSVEDYFESTIEGSDGNREFFLFTRPPQLALEI